MATPVVDWLDWQVSSHGKRCAMRRRQEPKIAEVTVVSRRFLYSRFKVRTPNPVQTGMRSQNMACFAAMVYLAKVTPELHDTRTSSALAGTKATTLTTAAIMKTTCALFYSLLLLSRFVRLSELSLDGSTKHPSPPVRRYIDLHSLSWPCLRSWIARL
jgi:hypothetical protein